MIQLFEITDWTVINPERLMAISKLTLPDGTEALEFLFPQGGLQVPHTPELELQVEKFAVINWLPDAQPVDPDGNVIPTPDETATVADDSTTNLPV